MGFPFLKVQQEKSYNHIPSRRLFIWEIFMMLNPLQFNVSLINSVSVDLVSPVITALMGTSLIDKTYYRKLFILRNYEVKILPLNLAGKILTYLPEILASNLSPDDSM